MTKSACTKPGCLYIVATPIGNLNDISLRAIATLKEVHLILAEDTRHANILLQHYQIQTPVESFHMHNECQKTERYFNMLQKSTQIALISDAGTPLINDPGYPLVRIAREHGIPVVPVPGANAIICALSAAGVDVSHFSFYGFPPAKCLARQQFFQSCLQNTHTLVFYESSHRIVASLQDLEKILGSEQVIQVVKELTKMYERFYHAKIPEILDWLQQDSSHQKGEFVIIIPPREAQSIDEQETVRILKILCTENPNKTAIEVCHKITRKPKNYLYKLAIELKMI